jgi:hypothetical protein
MVRIYLRYYLLKSKGSITQIHGISAIGLALAVPQKRRHSNKDVSSKTTILLPEA